MPIRVMHTYDLRARTEHDTVMLRPVLRRPSTSFSTSPFVSSPSWDRDGETWEAYVSRVFECWHAGTHGRWRVYCRSRVQ